MNQTKKIGVEIFRNSEDVPKRLNLWLSQRSVRVINIESVLESNGGDGNWTGGKPVNIAVTGIRVWYEEFD